MATYGGAIGIDATHITGDLLVTQSDIIANGAGGYPGEMQRGGGGIGIFDPHANVTRVEVRQCVLEENRIGRGDPRGAALLAGPNLGGPLRLINSTVQDSRSRDGVGGIIGVGAVFVQGDVPIDLVNVAVTGNEVGDAPVFLDAGTQPLNLTNVTVAGNRTTLGDPGLVLRTTGPIRIANSIIWGNRNDGLPPGPQVSSPVERTRLDYCDIEGGPGPYAGDNNIAVDPHFGYFAYGVPQLSALSPCIDAGNADLLDLRPDRRIDLDDLAILLAIFGERCD